MGGFDPGTGGRSSVACHTLFRGRVIQTPFPFPNPRRMTDR
jgi:hypothetical protein